jgi:hypothetical protein
MTALEVIGETEEGWNSDDISINMTNNELAILSNIYCFSGLYLIQLVSEVCQEWFCKYSLSTKNKH